jgi:hypothetical protein
MSFNDRYSFDSVKTILTQGDFELLQSGNVTDAIIEKLISEENQRLFEEVQQEESDVLQYEYSLTDAQVKSIFEHSPYGYRDRGLVGMVYDDAEEAAREYCDGVGAVSGDGWLEQYIDYEAMGEDFKCGEQYFELDDGRLVYLSL